MVPDVVQTRILSSILDHNKQKHAAISVYAQFFSAAETSLRAIDQIGVLSHFLWEKRERKVDQN
jgi:hypothetical protein